jgi:hypothetical protein
MADAAPAPVRVGPKKRFWYLVDADGNRVERDGKEPKIHGKNPFQAVQKAVTRYATEAHTEYTFHLREAKGKPTKAGKLRVYTYKGWKTPLTDAERSEFTVNMSITSKPHAKSLGVTLIDAPPAKKRARAPKPEAAAEAATPDASAAAPKKRARKIKSDGEAAKPDSEATKSETAAEPPAKKKRAGKAAKPDSEATKSTAEAPKTPKKRGGKATKSVGEPAGEAEAAAAVSEAAA